METPSLFELHRNITPTNTAESTLQRIHGIKDQVTAQNAPEPTDTSHHVAPVIDQTKTDFTKYRLLPFTDPLLTKRPEPFDFETPNYLDYAPTPLAYAEALYERMLRLDGVGLSSNQIGLPFRVFVFGNHTTRNYIFNPEVVGVSEEMSLLEEGCLSFPGFRLTLKRPKQCGVTFQTETGARVVSTLDNWAARIFLHEYDHMEGVTFLQWASKEKIDWELNKVTKKLKKLKRNKKPQLQPKRS